MIQINPADVEVSLDEGATAWRISSTLREFATPEDIDVIFQYPVHRVTMDLKEAMPMSGMDRSTNSRRGNAAKKSKKEKKYKRLCAFVENWDEIDTKVPKSTYPTITEAVEYFKSDKGFSYSSIKRWVQDNDYLVIQNGVLMLNEGVQNEDDS